MVPGPGNYELGKNRQKMKGCKFNHALRTFVTRETTPGPGFYKG